MISRLFQAIFTPGTIPLPAVPDALTETVRVPLDSLNTANEAGELGKFLGSKCAVSACHFPCFRDRLATRPHSR